jgi:hypothetical protein
LGPGGKRPDQVSDALQVSHDLHAGQQFSRLLLGSANHRSGNALIELAIKVVELLFALGDSPASRRGIARNVIGGR